MSNRSHLFQLIKSMSRSEKGYFKKQYSQSGLGKKNQYLELFDAIDAQEEYDSEALAQEFEIKKKFTQLPVAKNYLHKIILKSLRSYHAQSSVDIEVNEILTNVEILYNKRLLDLCFKELNKAEELLTKQDMPHKYAEVARWKKNIINQWVFSSNVEEERKKLYEKEKLFLQITDNLTEYSYLSFRLFSAYTKTGMARDPEMLKLADEIISHNLLLEEGMAKSTRAKFFFYNIKAKYYEIKNDYENTHLYNRRFIDLMEDTPGYIQANLKSYVFGLYNLLLSCARLRKHHDFFPALEDLLSVQVKYSFPDDFKITIKMMALNVELFYLLNTGNFKEALNTANNAITFLNQEDDSQQAPQMYVELYYFIAYSYFGNGEYDMALSWLNRIINNSSWLPREDMLCYARILNLVCHFEIGNQRFVDYNLKSTYRFLSKMHKVYKFETAILSFIRTLLKTPGRALLQDKLIDLREKLQHVATNPYEQNAFEYFDFISWLDSKLEKREFSQLVLEKNLKLTSSKA